METYRPFSERTMSERLGGALKVMLVVSVLCDLGQLLFGALGVIK